MTVLYPLAVAALALAVPAVALRRQHHRHDLDRQMRRLTRQHQKGTR